MRVCTFCGAITTGAYIEGIKRRGVPAPVICANCIAIYAYQIEQERPKVLDLTGKAPLPVGHPECGGGL